MLIRNVRPWGADPSDVRIADGLITAIEPAAAAGVASFPAPSAPSVSSAGSVLDGRGRILLPSFADAHLHLDSNRLGLPFRPHTAGTADAPATLRRLIDNDRAHWREAETSMAERAAAALGLAIARGGTHFRSYAQVDADCGLERLEAVLAAKQQHQDRAQVTVMAFPQAGILLEPGVPALLKQALQSGAEVIGGLDPCALDRDPIRHLDVVFGLAEKFGVPVDVHLHERGSLGAFSIELIAERTAALGMQGRVTLSHAFALGAGNDDATVGGLIELLAAQDISVTTVAPAGSGVLPIRRLTEAGVRVGLGQDGMRDYWSPYGNADLLDRTWQLAFTQGFRPDELIEYCVAVAGIGGRSVIDPAAPRITSIADRPGLTIGDPADLVLVPGDSVTAAVMDRGEDRTVIRAGTVVADRLQLLPAG